MKDGGGDAALRWHPIDVPLPAEGRCRGFEAAGLRLLLCNADGTPYVIADECPHMRVSLSGGTLRGTVLECPLHGGKIDVRDGSAVARPIRKAAVCFPVRPVPGGFEVALRGAAAGA